MLYPVAESIRQRAKTPHELAVVNLLACNLTLLIALLAGSFLPPGSALADYRLAGILVPWLLSLAIIGYSIARARQAARREHWLVAAHWRLTVARYRILLIAYLGGAALIGLGWLLSSAYSDPRMQGLLFLALERVAVAPLLVVLMVLVVLESSGLYQAMRGEVPNRIVAQFPPPPDLVGTEATVD